MLIYPFFGVLITGAIMMFLVEPPVGWLNTQLNLWLESLNGVSGVVLGALLAGMMAIDMGGPFNKSGVCIRHGFSCGWKLCRNGFGL